MTRLPNTCRRPSSPSLPVEGEERRLRLPLPMPEPPPQQWPPSPREESQQQRGVVTIHILEPQEEDHHE